MEFTLFSGVLLNTSLERGVPAETMAFLAIFLGVLGSIVGLMPLQFLENPSLRGQLKVQGATALLVTPVMYWLAGPLCALAFLSVLLVSNLLLAYLNGAHLKQRATQLRYYEAAGALAGSIALAQSKRY